MTRVLVTGGGGFIGRYAVAALRSRRLEVCVASRQARPELGVAHHCIDFLSAASFRDLLATVRPDVILHLAWTVEHGRFWTAPENLDWIAATFRLARAAAAAGIPRFVGVGTCMEYDWSYEPGRPRRESDPLAGSQLYSEAKIATYRVLERFFAGQETTFAWARVFHPYGPGEPETKLFPSIGRAMRAGQAMTISSGPYLRDFIAGVDVGSALAGIATSMADGPVNVATGEPHTIEQAARIIRDLLNGTGTLEFPAPQAGQEPAAMSADVSRLRNEFGVAPPPPLQIRLKENLAQAYPSAFKNQF